MNKFLANLCCCFIWKKKNRHHFRKKYFNDYNYNKLYNNIENYKNVLFINDTSGGYHWGCYGTSTKIKEKIIETSANLRCRSVRRTHHTKLVPDKVEDFDENFNKFKENNFDLVNDIQNSDYVLINGEGTIHHFGNGARALLYIMYISKKFFNKKVFAINHSCFPYSEDEQVLNFYKKCYECCDYVAVREQDSFDIVKNTLGIDNVVLAFDSLPLKIKDIYDNITEYKNDKKYICLSGAVNFDYSKIETILKCLNSYFNDYDLVFLTGSMRGNDDGDINIYNEMLKFNKNIKLVEAKSLEEWCSVIKSSEFLLSGRYHYTIGAMSLKTKSIQFESNTGKISAIRKMFNLPIAISFSDEDFETKLNKELEDITLFMQPDLLDEICEYSKNNYNWRI